MGEIKSTAIPYAGYEYQTLYGVKRLLDWVENPSIYSQICFEADTSDVNIPAAIDDIVCQRSDDTFEYYQVKFTTDESKHTLSWDWLFFKTKKGRSLVKKLFDGLQKIDSSKLYSAELITNRVPSESLNAALSENYLILTKLSIDIKSKFIEELETEENVRFLLTHLKFTHSQKNILKLRIELLSDAFSLGASDFIHHLMDEARIWATHKNRPNVGGWIFLQDIKNILSTARPKPLPQNFRIPDGYTPPCETFHSELIKSIVNKKDNIFVIIGPPGRGKSTYLSYLTTKLGELDTPYIRHHYFLSTADKTGDRLSHFKVQNDFQQQLKLFHGFDYKTFIEGLQVSAKHYEVKGKPLVVLIDGLDHVWRDNNEDIRPLNSLFNELFPPVNNVIYVIGTQPIEDVKLPKKLLQFKRRKEWLTLPPLTGNAILKFLQNQVAQGRLALRCHENHKEEQLKESAAALFDLTLGHPLSLIYISEQLIISKTPINAYEISKLPKSFGDHIYDYYSEFWRVISYPQKYALHIVSEFNFGWNKIELNGLLSNGELVDHVSGIQHLFFRSRTGYKPFHESLIAFVKSLPEHKQVIDKYIPEIRKWIRDAAPDYTKNMWSVKCNLMVGNVGDIKTNLTRDWVVKRLSEGYFLDELENILEGAVFYFMKVGELSEAHRFRTIKTRISNASQNTHHLTKLIELTLKKAPTSVIDEYMANVDSFTPEQLAQLSICLLHKGNKGDAKSLNKLSIESYNASYRLRTRQRDDTTAVSEIFRSEILIGHDISDKIKNFGESFYSDVITASAESSNLEALLKYHNLFDNVKYSKLAELAYFRIAITDGIDLDTLLAEKSFDSSIFFGFARSLSKPIRESYVLIEFPEERTVINSLSGSYSDEFFHVFDTLLQVEGDCSWLQCHLNLDPNFTHRESTPSKIFDAMFEAASYIRGCIIDEHTLSFSELLDSIYLCDLKYDNHWEQQAVNNFLHEFTIIALDCHLLFNKCYLDQDEIRYLIESDLYNSIRFFHWYEEQKQVLLTSCAVDLLLSSIIESSNDCDIQEKTNINISAGYIALLHKDETQADRYIRNAWDLTIGYGSYKDYSIHELIKSIDYLSEVDSEFALKILKKLTPFIANFDSLTTEGNSPKDEINEVLAKYSVGTLCSKYEHELVRGEASSANNTLNNLFKHGDITSPVFDAICRTGLLNENLRTLEERKKKGNNRSRQLLDIALEHNGSQVVMTKKEEYSSATVKEEKLDDSDYLRFPPEDFLSLGKEYKQLYLYDEHYRAWFEYWLNQGKQKELLKYLTPIVMDGTHTECRYIADPLFDLSVKHVGRNNSFKLLVAAHNQNQGWSTYYESANTFQRLDKVARLYMERANEFVDDTTHNFDSASLTLPYHKYTYLLCKLGRVEEAKEFVYSLAEQLIDETKILKPQNPHWNWEAVDETGVILDILIARLKVPIASVKWFVSQQLVELLLNESISEVLENKLLQKLSAAKIELQSIEFLTIFYFASCLGYKPNTNLSRAIKARSICSDLIIERMGFNPEDGEHAFDSIVFESQPSRTLMAEFNFSNGRNFPSVYYESLSRLQQKARFPFPLPLTEVMRSEWCRMQKDTDSFDSYLGYYINEDGYSKDLTALVYPVSGLLARSAYLRGLQFAKTNYELPRSLHESKANLAFPFDTCLFFLKPEKTIDIYSHSWSSEPTAINQILKELILVADNSIEGQQLGALSFSIVVDENTFLEIEIVRVSGMVGVHNLNEKEPWIWRYSNTSLVQDKEIKTIPEKKLGYAYIAAKSYPFECYGHWHSELESRGIYCPIYYGEDENVKMTYFNNSIQFILKGKKIGTFKFSNNNWKPSYHKNASPNIVSTLMLDKANRNYFNPIVTDESFYCAVKILTRVESYSDIEVSKNTFIIKAKQ